MSVNTSAYHEFFTWVSLGVAAGETLSILSSCLFPDSEWEGAHASRAVPKPDSDKWVIMQQHLYLNATAGPVRCVAKMETWWFCFTNWFCFWTPFIAYGNRDMRESRGKQSKNQVKPFCLLLFGLVSPVPVWTSLRGGACVHRASFCEPPSLTAHASAGWVPCLSLPHMTGLGSRTVVGLGSGVGF